MGFVDRAPGFPYPAVVGTVQLSLETGGKVIPAPRRIPFRESGCYHNRRCLTRSMLGDTFQRSFHAKWKIVRYTGTRPLYRKGFSSFLDSVLLSLHRVDVKVY